MESRLNAERVGGIGERHRIGQYIARFPVMNEASVAFDQERIEYGRGVLQVNNGLVPVEAFIAAALAHADNFGGIAYQQRDLHVDVLLDAQPNGHVVPCFGLGGRAEQRRFIAEYGTYQHFILGAEWAHGCVSFQIAAAAFSCFFRQILRSVPP